MLPLEAQLVLFPAGQLIYSTELFGKKIDSSSPDQYLAKLRLEKIGRPTRFLAADSAGFVFQTFNLLATMSAFENVELPMTLLAKRNRSERKRRVKELLASAPPPLHAAPHPLPVVGLGDRMEHLV